MIQAAKDKPSFHAKGTNISVVAADPKTPQVFYAANNPGLFKSEDGGVSWRNISDKWPDRFLKQHAMGIGVGIAT
jgi:hypothetical protein